MSEISILRNVPVHGNEYQLPHRVGDARPVQASLHAEVIAMPQAAVAVDKPVTDVSTLIREAYEKGFSDGQAALQAQVEAQAKAVASEVQAKEEQARAKAEEAGWRAGMAKADAEAAQREQEREARAQSALKERLAALDEILSKGHLAWADRVEELEADAVALCHSVVCRIVGTAAGDASATQSIVKQALTALAEPPRRVVMHPADLAALGGNLPSAFPGVIWEADGHAERGSLRVVGDEASLDARLAEQMEAFRGELLRIYAAPRSTEDQP